MFGNEVVVIDYGMGNLPSVKRGFEHIGARVLVSADPKHILAAQRVVLPGVGAFPDAMEELVNRKLVEVIREVAAKGTPLLGICLGMQLFLEVSQEYATTAGIGLISGQVVHIPQKDFWGRSQKIPHIGWNGLQLSRAGVSWDATPLRFIRPDESVYFVHSFMVEPLFIQDSVADCYYGGRRISSVIGRGNVWGCQFHPEKSGEVGLRVLRGFMHQ